MRLHRHKQPYHHLPQDRTITTTVTTLTMQTKEQTPTQGSIMAETLIATTVLGQETRIPIGILGHPRQMPINMATIKAVLQTLTPFIRVRLGFFRCEVCRTPFIVVICWRIGGGWTG